MILNILITHTATELNLRQAKQLKSSEKNDDLTAALFDIMILLSFNTLKSYTYFKQMWRTDMFIAKMDLLTGQRKNQHSNKIIFTAETNSREKKIS